MEDHRLTVRLTHYWESLKGNRVFPEISQLNSEAIGDLWPKCFLVSLGNSPVGQYRYEYMGELIIAAFGRDLTGVTISNKTPKQLFGAAVVRKMNSVVGERKPMEDAGYFVNEQGRLIKYRACCLPFGDSKGALTHIVTGLSYRRF